MSGAPIIKGTNQLPLEMENSLATKSPQKTVRTTHIVYGSPEKIKTSFICTSLYIILTFNCQNFHDQYQSNTMNIVKLD